MEKIKSRGVMALHLGRRTHSNSVQVDYRSNTIQQRRQATSTVHLSCSPRKCKKNLSNSGPFQNPAASNLPELEINNKETLVGHDTCMEIQLGVEGCDDTVTLISGSCDECW